MATEEEIAAAKAEAEAAQVVANKAAEEAAAKVKAAEDALARVKAEAPAVGDIAALARKATEDIAAIRADQDQRTQRERDAALLRHVKQQMHYEGTLDDEDLLSMLRRAGADPSTKEGAEKLEAFREKHLRDFRARVVSHEAMAQSTRAALEADAKIKSNPFFSIERGMKSLGRKA